MDLNYLTIVQAHKGLMQGDFSAEELLEACLAQIARTEDLNNFITLTEGQAREQARRSDARIAKGESIGVLEGIPVGLKDLFCTAGVATSSASRMLKDFVPPYDATVVRRLEEVGYVLVGKNNLDEYACGVSTERSYFGTSLNPWDKAYVPGGSSGGSTSAVSAGQVICSLGTDTGGSIRLPASFCNVVGFKPTYGRVSRFGVTAMASSWDHVGPITRTVEDAAILMNVLAGHDPYDATTPKIDVPDYRANLSKGVQGLRIGLPKEYFGEGVSEEVRELVQAAVKEYERMGAVIKEVELPMMKYGVAIYYVCMPGELSTNLARMDGMRFGYKPGDMEDLEDYIKRSRGEGFGEEIKRRVMLGTFVLSAGHADAYYKQAQRARTLVIRDFERVFEEVDVLMGPVSPTPPFKVGELLDDPLALYLADLLTIPANAAGIPALSLPCGFTKDGLPVGFQIMTPHWKESLALQVGAAYEQATDWHTRRPAL